METPRRHRRALARDAELGVQAHTEGNGGETVEDGRLLARSRPSPTHD